MESFLLEVPARTQLMKTMFACKSWNTKNLCQMGHAIKGGKLILFQRVVIIFRLELHLWTHPLLLKNFFISFTNYFWNLLVLHTDKLYALVCLIYLFNSIYVICIHDLAWYDQTAIMHSAIETYGAILPQWQGHFVYSICTCLNEVYIIRSTTTFLSKLCELTVGWKKTVLSRILVLSSLPHSR